MQGTKQLVFRGLILRILSTTFLLLIPVTQASAQRRPLPVDEQEAVNRAIDRGVEVLKLAQLPTGTWALPEAGHQVGYAALPALTLLECGLSPRDPLIQRAARLVREKAAKLDGTYELALSILFLDRLGDPKDKKYVQWFSARLIAGQSVTGGWGYKCPPLDTPTHLELLATLRQLEKSTTQERVLGTGIAESSVSGTSRLTESAPPSDAKPVEKPAKPVKPLVIPARLRNLPVMVDPKQHVLQDPEDKANDLIVTTTDNSNTQFALLGLWAAQRHVVPVKRTMNLVVRRFETSQNQGGDWGYHYRKDGGQGGSPAMTSVGLIGLAIAYGLDGKAIAGQPVKDKRLINGLTALSKHVGKPLEDREKPPMQNLYFLWSVERVGVLYNLPTIGDKDWYRWGAQVLVAHQETRGNWDKGEYPGSSPIPDTCLALLFLKRANLTKDLTSRLSSQSANLDSSVVEKLTPPPAPPPTPPKSITPTASKPKETLVAKPGAEQKPIAKPIVPLEGTTATRAPESGVAADNADSGSGKKWLAGGMILVATLAGGGAILLFFVSRRRAANEEEAEEEKPRKKRKKPATANKT